MTRARSPSAAARRTPGSSGERRARGRRRPSGDDSAPTNRNSVRKRHLRTGLISHRLLDNYGAIVEALCRAWSAPTKERLRSFTACPYQEEIGT